MAQDYAKKAQTRKGAVRRSPVSKGKKKKSAKGRKIVSILLLLAVIGAMGFGLYRLALVDPDPQVTQEKVHAEAEGSDANPTESATDKQNAPLVEDRKKDYTFYEILPKSEVVPPDVPEYKSTPKSAKSYSIYVLQAGSFRNSADADRLRAQLILEGLPNVITNKVESSDGSLWYRVRTGPFDSRSKLNKAQDKLVRMNLQPLQVKLAP